MNVDDLFISLEEIYVDDNNDYGNGLHHNDVDVSLEDVYDGLGKKEDDVENISDYEGSVFDEEDFPDSGTDPDHDPDESSINILKFGNHADDSDDDDNTRIVIRGEL